MNDLRMGWLSPFGEFYPCSIMEHVYISEKIAKEKFKFKDKNITTADDFLLKHGYVHITINSFLEHCWCVYWDFTKHLTNIQKEFLKPYFEDTLLPMNDNSKTMWEYEMR